MTKLPTLKSSLPTLTSRIAFSEKPGHQPSERTAPPTWKRWYHTARWSRLRIHIFARDMFKCQMCGRLQGDTSLLVADHVKPHRGSPTLFWDEANIQTLCANCHSSAKQREENRDGPAGLWY